MTKDRQWKLLRRLNELETTKRELASLQVPDKSGDFGDEAQRTSEQGVAVELNNSMDDEIYRIKSALQNNSDLCINCNDEISERRLEARPEATLCLRCQMADEKRERPKQFVSYNERRRFNYGNKRRGQ